MNKIKCIVVDDDSFSLNILEKMIEKTDFLEFSGGFENPVKAVDEIVAIDPQIVFLDVEMPEITGFDLLGTLGKGRNIIITSSSEKYALTSYDYDIIDFLLKPIIEYSRFLKAVIKVKEKLNGSNQEDNVFATRISDSIFVKIDSVFIKIRLEEVDWIEAFGDYVKIKTSKKLYTVYSTLTRVEGKLPDNEFIRVHRSFVVNVNKIDKIDQNALQIGEQSIPIGNSHRKKLLSYLNLL